MVYVQYMVIRTEITLTTKATVCYNMAFLHYRIKHTVKHVVTYYPNVNRRALHYVRYVKLTFKVHLHEFLIGHLVFVIFEERYSENNTNNQL